MDKKYVIQELEALSRRYHVELEPSTLEDIVHSASIRVLPKEEIICHIGETAKNVGMVLSGILRSYYIDEEGNDITRGFSVTGSLCMDEGMFGYDKHICEWETLEDAVIMFFDAGSLKEKIYRYPDLKNAYIYLLEKALQYKIYRENGFLVENASQRYMHFIKLYPELSDKVLKRHIATYLGIAPESLSRIRKAMKDSD